MSFVSTFLALTFPICPSSIYQVSLELTSSLFLIMPKDYLKHRRREGQEQHHSHSKSCQAAYTRECVDSLHNTMRGNHHCLYHKPLLNMPPDDIENQSATYLAKQADPDGTSTIGLGFISILHSTQLYARRFDNTGYPAGRQTRSLA